MNKLTIFDYEGEEIRTLLKDGEPWFVAKDVCAVLGIQNVTQAVQRLEDDEHSMFDIGCSGGPERNMVNESGLYALILRSDKPEAKKFRKWVTSEVLPSIRKQGGYMVVRPDESDEAIMARALQIMQATLQRRDEEIARLKPKADYADQVLDSVSCLTTTQVAKGMGMTAMELNRILCEKGIQYGQSGQYLLYASYARKGLAQNRTRTFLDLFGTVHTTSQLVWTEKGREFIHKLLLN